MYVIYLGALKPNSELLGLNAFKITGATAATPPSRRSLGFVFPVIYKAIAAERNARAQVPSAAKICSVIVITPSLLRSFFIRSSILGGMPRNFRFYPNTIYSTTKLRYLQSRSFHQKCKQAQHWQKFHLLSHKMKGLPIECFQAF